MKSKKIRVVCAGGLLAFFVGTSHAAGDGGLWDGLYLQTSSGKNIEFKHNNVRTMTRKTWGENRIRVSCLALNPDKDHNLIKDAAAKDIKSAFFKPTAKYAAQMFEVKQMEVEAQYEYKPEKQFCYDSNSNDLFPKSRNVSGGTQFQVSPSLKPGRYYVINKDNNTRDALIKFAK